MFSGTHDPRDRDDQMPEKELRKRAPEKSNSLRRHNSIAEKQMRVSVAERYRHAWSHESKYLASRDNQMPEEELRKRAPERPKPKEREPDQIKSNKSDSDYELQLKREYPENWDTLRKQAYERDDYRC